MPSRSAAATSTAAPLPSSASADNGYCTLLRDRNFALFFAAFSISTVGTAAVPVALSFALLGAGYSASAVGFVLAAPWCRDQAGRRSCPNPVSGHAVRT